MALNTPLKAAGLQLAQAYTVGSGSMVLKPGQGANFTAFPCLFTAITSATYGTGLLELKASYTCAGKTGDTLTGVAVLAGYADLAFSANDYVEGRPETSLITDLNAAVTGKADNATVVHTTGIETIGGFKTFTTAPILGAVTGLLKAVAGAISTAAAGTDYYAPGGAISAADLPLASPAAFGAVKVGSGIAVSGGVISVAAGGSGTVTSVGQSVPSWLTVTGSPVTSAGTLAISGAPGQAANQILATPDGSTGAVGLRSIAVADVPTLNQNTTGSAASLSATLVPTKGGTGLTSYAAGDLLYASAANTLASLAVGFPNQALGLSVASVPSYMFVAAGGGITSGSSTLTASSASYLFVDTTTGSWTITLPSASIGLKPFVFIRVGATNTATIQRAGTDLFSDGSTSKVLGVAGTTPLSIVSDGVARWGILTQPVLMLNSGGLGFTTIGANAIVVGTNGPAITSTLVPTITHVVGGGTAPTVAAVGTGAGTGPTGPAITAGSHDLAGEITLTTGTSPGVSTTVLTVTFGLAFALAPIGINLQPSNAAARALASAAQLYPSAATTGGFTLSTGSAGLTASTAYVWKFLVIG
jgi:hypothetical protein